MRFDEEAAGVILRPLDEDPHTPSTIDIGRAVSAGRRRRQIRRIGAYAATAGATALALVGGTVVAGTSRPGGPAQEPAAAPTASTAAPPAAPTQCAINLLPLPDGRTMALVTGGDPTGRYLLGRTYPAGNNTPADGTMGVHLVIWDRLEPTQVSMPGDDQSFHDINSGGLAVGDGWIHGTTTAFYYRDGKVTKLPGGDGAEVRAINEAGAAVGIRADKPVIWRSVDQEPTTLALPSGAVMGSAYDIDDDGTVLGAVGDRSYRQPYVWGPDGTGHPLPVPTGAVPSPSGNPAKAGGMGSPALAFHLRNGWASGRIWSTAVRWNLRTGEVRTFADLDGSGNAVNRYGWQIGTNRQGQGVLQPDAGPVALPDLAAHKPGGLANIPTTVSDDGSVIGGQSDDKNGTIRAVIWTCV